MFFKILQIQITKWAGKTFPQQTSYSKMEHMKKEVEELQHELALANRSREMILEETADIVILFLNYLVLERISFYRLYKSCKMKMKKNKARKWSKPDKLGVYHHIND